jgi:integrase
MAGAGGLTPDELRHSAAGLAVSAGTNVNAVQRMLGHASAAMTLDLYLDLFDDDLKTVDERGGDRPLPRRRRAPSDRAGAARAYRRRSGSCAP